jgi:glycosyltransferase involved in cell wall biosynthesis
MSSSRRPVVAINTLSVTPINAGTLTILRDLIPALQEIAPDLDVLLVGSKANRPLLDPDAEVLELSGFWSTKIRRILADQVVVPWRIRKRADLLVTLAGVPTLRSPVPQVAIVSAHLALPSCNAAAGDDGMARLHSIYYGRPFRRGLHRCAAVLGISQFVADGVVRELGVPAEVVHAMPLGFVPPPWVVEPRTASPEPPMVLYVGTLYGYKDVPVAVRAFARARADLPEGTRFTIVGQDLGDEMTVIRRAMAEEGVADVVDMVGRVSPERLEELYTEATVLVLPSRCEGFGLPALEAMGRGLPVIVAAATSLPEVVGDAGVQVPVGDVAGFARAMVEVVGDPARQLDLSARGLARARAMTWDVTARHLLEAIRGVLSRS